MRRPTIGPAARGVPADSALCRCAAVHHRAVIEYGGLVRYRPDRLWMLLQDDGRQPPYEPSGGRWNWLPWPLNNRLIAAHTTGSDRGKRDLTLIVRQHHAPFDASHASSR